MGQNDFAQADMGQNDFAQTDMDQADFGVNVPAGSESPAPPQP